MKKLEYINRDTNELLTKEEMLKQWESDYGGSEMAFLEQYSPIRSTTDYDDAFFVDKDKETVTWIYFNPDSSSGGQYVTNTLSFEDISHAAAEYTTYHERFNYLESVARQTLADLGTNEYDIVDRQFASNPDITDYSLMSFYKLCIATNVSCQKPLGKINYLHTNGKIRESIEFDDEDKFIQEFREENYYGVPMTVELYADQDGNTLARQFILECDPIIQGFEVVPLATNEAEDFDEDIEIKLDDDFTQGM